MDNYHHKVLTFPEGLEYIGTEAFYNVNRLNDNVMYGIVFPSTLRAINVRAFANAGRIGEDLYQNPIPIPGELTFKGNFNPENMREEAFSPIQGRNYVKYIRAPNIEIATNIANYISVVYEDDFRKIDSTGRAGGLQPSTASSVAGWRTPPQTTWKREGGSAVSQCWRVAP